MCRSFLKDKIKMLKSFCSNLIKIRSFLLVLNMHVCVTLPGLRNWERGLRGEAPLDNYSMVPLVWHPHPSRFVFPPYLQLLQLSDSPSNAAWPHSQQLCPPPTAFQEWILAVLQLCADPLELGLQFRCPIYTKIYFFLWKFLAERNCSYLSKIYFFLHF